MTSAPDSKVSMPCSYAQQRLWLVQQSDPGSGFYLVPMSLRITGKLDVDALETALNSMVARHESLRTHFPGS
jgi:Condensation domain